MSSVAPEMLLDYGDCWEWTKKKDSSCFLQNLSEVEFKAISVQAWTCVLMQVIKVCNMGILDDIIYNNGCRILGCWGLVCYVCSKTWYFIGFGSASFT